jgi:hypothetical protein
MAQWRALHSLCKIRAHGLHHALLQGGGVLVYKIEFIHMAVVASAALPYLSPL